MSSPLHVEPHDHVLRFLVASDSQTDVKHLVDLGAFNGNGRCSCQHFEFRILPELEAGKVAGKCKHVQACREYLADEVIERVLAQGPNPHE